MGVCICLEIENSDELVPTSDAISNFEYQISNIEEKKGHRISFHGL
jgi:hypothetical protein